MTITHRFFMLAISYTRFCVYLSQQNVQRDILGKHAKYPVAIQTMDICMRWYCKKQYCSHIKCYQVWKITCNNAICGQRLIIWQDTLFWLVFQNVIKITSILSLLNEATTIKNIFSKSIDTCTYNCFTSIRLKRYFWLVEKKEFGCLCQKNWA